MAIGLSATPSDSSPLRPPAPAGESVAVGHSPGLAWVRLSGELDLASRARVEAALAGAENAQPSLLVLDLSGLELIDSTGLRVVLAAERRASEDGRRLVLLAGGPAVQRAFRVTGLDDAVEIVADPSFLPEPPL